ncbi:MAG: SRPBCC family protein [Hyphomonadaceae bacterium]|nr:MAG: hypothetical protein FD160_3282 [Caulobacteraceae bacterium]MBT9446765.1 SRPBCC family protein [Hyphomonadaceae bacterium]TPW03544.1 MAG: hypothetical protein FD124_2966 [Alphaproteobacteria bacterium]
MRWIAIAIAVLAAAAAILFGVGYFVLPAKLVVERHIEIARPRAAVFALLDNLNTFNEWSPWFAADPQAVYKIEGDSGVGQKAVWVSKGGRIGSGSQRITRSVANERVETLMDFGARGSAKTIFALERAATGSKVSWSFVSDCTANPIYVPCRYLNFVTASAIALDYETGLERLKALAEQLPAVDFERLAPEYAQPPVVNFAFVENDVTRDQALEGTPSVAEGGPDLEAAYAQRVQSATAQSFSVVEAKLAEAGATISGPRIMVTVSQDDARIVFRAGYPFQGPAPVGDPRVTTATTPAGRALKFVHVGSSSAMGATYQMIGAWLEAHRVQSTGQPWEVYVQPNGDLAQRRTEIYIPIH